MQLDESFAGSKVELEIYKNTDTEMDIRFEVDDLKIEVWMIKNKYTRTENSWVMGFWATEIRSLQQHGNLTNWSYGLTRRFESIKTLSGVIDAIRLFVDKKKPKELSFDANPKKSNLYKKILSRIDLKGFKVKVSNPYDDPLDVEFTLVRSDA